MDELATALASTGYAFAHYGWSRAPAGDYGVYAEDGAEDLTADGHHAEKATECTVDFFTRDDSKSPREAIESALEAFNAPWYLNTVQFEDDTGHIHYEWVVTVV